VTSNARTFVIVEMLVFPVRSFMTGELASRAGTEEQSRLAVCPPEAKALTDPTGKRHTSLWIASPAPPGGPGNLPFAASSPVEERGKK
jgi:hypothetical protein